MAFSVVQGSEKQLGLNHAHSKCSQAARSAGFVTGVAGNIQRRNTFFV
jgi:hypothetical protein